LWLREQDVLDSKRGYIATNLDYVWKNYKTGDWMLIEEKRYGHKPRRWQHELFRQLHRVCTAAGGSAFHGFHLIVFENTSPEDGRIWLDNKEISKDDLILFLQFKR